jgi:hypothetical protein
MVEVPCRELYRVKLFFFGFRVEQTIGWLIKKVCRLVATLEHFGKGNKSFFGMVQKATPSEDRVIYVGVGTSMQLFRT